MRPRIRQLVGHPLAYLEDAAARFFCFNPFHTPRRRVGVSNQFTSRGKPEVKQGRCGGCDLQLRETPSGKSSTL
jgi:hypothetical protein